MITLSVHWTCWKPVTHAQTWTSYSVLILWLSHVVLAVSLFGQWRVLFQLSWVCRVFTYRRSACGESRSTASWWRGDRNVWTYVYSVECCHSFVLMIISALMSLLCTKITVYSCSANSFRFAFVLFAKQVFILIFFNLSQLLIST